MGRAKIHIPVSALARLYVRRKASLQKIAEQFGCTSATVRRRLIEAGIPLKSKSAAQTKYPKRDFSGSEIEWAYMLGFKYGDLNAYVPSARSHTVVVRCHTTHLAQEAVFRKLFRQYGAITASRNDRSVHLNCYLNDSFRFLLGKYPPDIRKQIRGNDALMAAFASGYVDAEGTFGINQGKGRFKIDAYDRTIVRDIHAFLIRSGIRSKLRLLARKGSAGPGYLWNADLWRLTVNEAGSLERLVAILNPYLLHAKRRRDARIVLFNIKRRRKHGTIA
jgi:hypothetical protein